MSLSVNDLAKGQTKYVAASTTGGDNAVVYTSGDVSMFNYHVIESITTAHDVEASIDGTNFVLVYTEDTQNVANTVMAITIPAGEFGILKGKFKKIRVLQDGAGAASSVRVLHGNV